jgi:uncharacterized protein YukJ
MPLTGYGVLRGKAIDRRREGSSDTPHFQIRVADGVGVDFRIAVNVKSQSAPSELLYLLEDDFQHPVTARLETLGPGWHAAGGRRRARQRSRRPARRPHHPRDRRPLG